MKHTVEHSIYITKKELSDALNLGRVNFKIDIEPAKNAIDEDKLLIIWKEEVK